MTEEQPQQRPKKKEDIEGRICFAHNVHWALPSHITNAISLPYASGKLSALKELQGLHSVGNTIVRQRVLETVRMLADDDSKSVSQAAHQFLSEILQKEHEQAQRDARQAAEREAAEQAQRDARQAAEREAAEQAQRDARQAAEREAAEQAQRDARQAAEREAAEQAQRDARQAAEREAAEQAQRDARQAAEREAAEQAQRDARQAAEREAAEQAQRDARQAAERKAAEQAQRDARQAAERKAAEQAQRDARQAAERKAAEQAQRDARQAAERKAAEQAQRDARQAAERKAAEQATAAPPKLELSTLAVDFGRIRVGSKTKPRRVTVLRGGNLNVRITSAPEWIQAQHTGDTLTLRPDPKAPGSLIGDVQIDSNGGSARIRVTAIVDSPGTPHTRGYYQGDKLATWWQRVGANLIDWLPLIPGFVLAIVGGQTHSPGGPTIWPGGATIGILVMAPPWLYNRCYLQGRTGQSWGKQVMGLKLIRMSNKEPIGWWKAAIRDLAHYLDILILYLGFLLPIWDARRQTLADKAMRTVVISLKA